MHIISILRDWRDENSPTINWITWSLLVGFLTALLLITGDPLH